MAHAAKQELNGRARLPVVPLLLFLDSTARLKAVPSPLPCAVAVEPASDFPFPARTYKTGARPSVGEIARAIGAKVIGDERIAIAGVASAASAGEGDLVFVENAKHLHSALNSPAAAVIAGPFNEKTTTSKALLIVANPRLAFARAAFAFPTLSQKAREGWGNRNHSGQHSGGIHPSAVVLPSASIGEGVTVDPSAFVCDDASIAT